MILSLIYVSCWYCGSILVSNTRGGRFKPFYCNDKYFCHWNRWIQWQHLGKTHMRIDAIGTFWRALWRELYWIVWIMTRNIFNISKNKVITLTSQSIITKVVGFSAVSVIMFLLERKLCIACTLLLIYFLFALSFDYSLLNEAINVNFRSYSARKRIP